LVTSQVVPVVKVNLQVLVSNSNKGEWGGRSKVATIFQGLEEFEFGLKNKVVSMLQS
jgi:hypothetical protein